LKVLIIRLGAIGDIIRTVPAVIFLKKKLQIEEIHWIAEDWASNLLLNHPDINKVYIIPRKKYSKIFSILKEIRNCHYDYLLDFHGILKSGLISYFAGVKNRIGFNRNNCKELNFIFNNIKAPFISNKVTRIEKNFNLLKPLLKNFSIPDKLETNFYIEKEKIDKIELFYKSMGNYKIFIGINPCTSKAGEYKEWPIKYYKKLIENINQFYNNKAAFIVTWGPEEYDKIFPLKDLANTFIAPETDMKELMVLISKLNYFITGDTGPMHLASTLNIPVLALFGPSDSQINKPWGDKNVVAVVNVGCNPCRNKKCKDLKCQWLLTPEIVFNKFQELVNLN
jgi:heptosyltransferase-1